MVGGSGVRYGGRDGGAAGPAGSAILWLPSGCQVAVKPDAARGSPASFAPGRRESSPPGTCWRRWGRGPAGVPGAGSGGVAAAS